MRKDFVEVPILVKQILYKSRSMNITDLTLRSRTYCSSLNKYETKITISVVSTVYGASIADASKEII